jgi:glycosyltransferase involved in cell wall biosynthesis
MSENPTVSVLMSVYNTEPYLAQTMESMLGQTFEDFEFIIIDDGSTDSSRKILEEYAAKDKRICLTSRENRGISRTRNEMLAKARGEFIAVMDADDIALPERLARQVEFLQGHPHVVCVAATHEVIDEKGRLLLTRLEPPQHNDEIQRLALAGHQVFNHPSVMIRRAALVQIGGYDETLPLGHDMDLWLRLGEIGELAGMKDTLQKYRQRTNSVSKQKRIQQYEEVKEACQRAWRRRGIEGRFEVTEPWRGGTDRPSQHREQLMYGWWAFNSCQRQTALLYAIKAIVTLPFEVGGWKLLACAVIKPLPKSDLNKL